jgi:hypothetical protein
MKLHELKKVVDQLCATAPWADCDVMIRTPRDSAPGDEVVASIAINQHQHITAEPDGTYTPGPCTGHAFAIVAEVELETDPVQTIPAGLRWDAL